MRVVIKIGGSFQGSPTLRDICKNIASISRNHDLIIVPGGGEFANQVRKFCKAHDISEETAHSMAVLAMDIYGLGLTELIPGMEATEDLKRAEEGGAIFLPYRSVREGCELETSWEVTSDSLAAWVCGKIGFDKLVLMKRVDGIGEASPSTKISTRELKDLEQKVVDPKLPEVLERYEVTGWIINGERPGDLEDFLETGKANGTEIYPEGKK